MTDEELRRAYQAGTSAHPTGRRDCPDAEAISALVEQKGEEAGRLAVLDHVMACSDCRRDFELLRAVHGTGPAQSQRRFQPLALAASVALLVGLGGMGLWSALRTDRPDIQRSSSAQVELASPASGAVVSMPVQLVWRPVSDASSYTAELLTQDGRLIRTWVTADTNVSVPAPGDAAVPAGVYSWWVRARLGDGTERRSPLVHFKVR